MGVDVPHEGLRYGTSADCRAILVGDQTPLPQRSEFFISVPSQKIEIQPPPQPLTSAVDDPAILIGEHVGKIGSLGCESRVIQGL
jgi:hypothetical protein